MYVCMYKCTIAIPRPHLLPKPGTYNNKAGARLLYIAARYGHLPLCQWLIESGGADVHSRSTESGVMAHHAAAAYGHLECLQWLVKEAGSSVHARAEDMLTALHIAAEEGHLQICRWLVEEADADMFAKDEFGRIPKVGS